MAAFLGTFFLREIPLRHDEFFEEAELAPQPDGAFRIEPDTALAAQEGRGVSSALGPEMETRALD